MRGAAARGTPAPTLIIATRNRSPECGAASSRMRSRELPTQFESCAGHRGQRAARKFCRLSTAPSASLNMFWSSLAFPERCAPASQRPPCTLSTQAMLISWIRKSWLQQLLSHFPAAPAPLGLLAATAAHDALHLPSLPSPALPLILLLVTVSSNMLGESSLGALTCFVRGPWELYHTTICETSSWALSHTMLELHGNGFNMLS